MGYDIYPDMVGGPRGQADDESRVGYSRRFRIVFDRPQPDANYVGGLPEIPRLGTHHPTDINTLVTSIVPEQHPDDPSVWDVNITYSTQSADRLQLGPPLSRGMRINYSFTQYQRPAVTDKYGNAIKNSAGDLYVPAGQIDASRFVVHATANLPAVPIWMLDFQDAINDSDVTIEGITFPQYTLKANLHIGEWKYDWSQRYREVTVEMHHRRETWLHIVLDAGLRYISSDGTLKRIQDNGQNVTEPQMLDGKGGRNKPKIFTPQKPNPIGGDPINNGIDIVVATDIVEVNGFGATGFDAADAGKVISIAGAARAINRVGHVVFVPLVAPILQVLNPTQAQIGATADRTVGNAAAVVTGETYGYWHVYEEIDYGQLGLPETLQEPS